MAAITIAAVTLIGLNSGLAAQFEQSATARASIAVASSFDDVAGAALVRAVPAACAISLDDADDSAVMAADRGSLTVDLSALIAAGDPDWSSDVTVTNTTNKAVALRWSASVPTGETDWIEAADMPLSGTVDPGAAAHATLSIRWNAASEPPTGTVTFTAECATAPVATPSPSEPTTTDTDTDDPPPTTTTETTDTDTGGPSPTTTP